MGFVHALKDFNRLTKIAELLVREEFDYLVEKSNLRRYIPFTKKLKLKKAPSSTSIPERIRIILEELGGAFIKIGQLLSLRYDILPKEYCEEFAKLQDSVKPFPFEIAKKIIEQELKKPIKELFKEFNQVPIASASIGQVYQATLKNGKKVAVKVQKPNLAKIFQVDIDLMYHLADILQKHFEDLSIFNPRQIISEFEDYTKKEIDYLIEAKNIMSFYNNLHQSNIIIPQVIMELTTSKVLTMEFIEGEKLNSQNIPEEAKRYAVEQISYSIFEQLFYHKLFHADPHPGNILIHQLQHTPQQSNKLNQKKKAKKEIPNFKIGLLDYGIVGRVSDNTIEKIEKMFVAIMQKDENLLTSSLLELGSIPPETNMEQLNEEIVENLAPYYNISFEKINIQSFFNDVFKISKKYKISFPHGFVLLAKAIITIEGLCLQFHKQFNFIQAFQPKFKKLIKERSKTAVVIKKAKKTLYDFASLTKELPNQMKEIIEAYKKGHKVNIDVEDKDIKRFTAEIEKSSYQLTYTIMIAALIVSAAIIILAKLQPTYYGIPVLAWIIFTFILILIIIVTIKMFKY